VFSNRTAWKLTPNRFTLAHDELVGQGREILDLTVSNPTRASFSYDETAILDALRNPTSLDYDPQPKGLVSARKAVANYCGARLDSDSLVLTASTSEGYSYVFRLLCNSEDEVMVPKPSYPLFDFLADLQDVKLVPYPLIYDHGWQIDFPTLEQALTPKSRAIVLVHPNNPTGSFISAEERARLNQLCRERNLSLIVDEVFLDYAHDGSQHETFASNDQALTFTLSGLSKISGLPQMKLAWIAVSGPQKEATEAMQRLEILADTYLSVSAPVQLAAKTMLDQRLKLRPQLMHRIQTSLSELDLQLAKQKSCTRLALQGGWYAVLRVPVTRSDEDLAIELLTQKSVLVHPGHFYDFPTDGFLVLSLITPEPTFHEGISRLLMAI
jgi:alanine-synthesizing transaminase